MQPNRLAIRRLLLCFLFVASIVAIFVMSSRASADEIAQTEMTEAAVPELPSALEQEVIRDAHEAEARDDKIALYVNYMQLSGVTTELDGDEVIVPARFFAEAMLDCRVRYSAGSQRLLIEADGLYFDAYVGNYYVKANNRYLYIEDGVQLREDGQIWLPLSIMAKIIGCEYTLDIESRSAYLTPTGKFIKNGDKYYNSKDVYWLSRIINAESRGEPLLGQIAVGTVVMNRVAHDKFPDTVYGVIFQGNHFTPAVTGTINKTPLPQCVIAAKIVLEGTRVSDSILYFHSISKTNPRFQDFVNTEEELVIGKQFFYTDYSRR